MTVHRFKVLEYMQEHPGHPTIEDIYTYLAPQIPSLSRATVYNTLDCFQQVGIVREISMDGLEKRYDIILENHGHFRCTRCGTITNFKINIDAFKTDELSRFMITEKNVYFSGVCPDCAKISTV